MIYTCNTVRILKIVYSAMLVILMDTHRHRQTGRHRETERQRDRQTDRHTHTHTHTHSLPSRGLAHSSAPVAELIRGQQKKFNAKVLTHNMRTGKYPFNVD